jgi:uncharacterized damage-inducible protein DinB
MSEPILDAFRHDAWATRTLIDFCRGLDEGQLSAKTPEVFGGVLETLKHLITGESYYSSLFTGTLPAWDVRDAPAATLDQLDAWNTEMESTWEGVLAAGVDGDALLSWTRSDGSLTEVRAGVMLAQALHHSNVHREQISAVLTGLGLTPPDISGWGYGRAAERLRVQRAPGI